MKNHPTTLLMIVLAISACDGAQDDPTMRDEELGSNEDIDPEDIDPESVMEFVDRGRWENGLEELLDPVCDEHGCRWVWTDLEQAGLGEIVDLLPEVPEDLDHPEDLDGPVGPFDTTEWPSGASDITTTAEAGKTITITSIRCLDRQELGGDEPYIVVDGVRRWSGSGFYVGDSNQLSVSRAYASSAVVEVWEDDSVYDDKIGEKTFTLASTSGNTTFYGSDAAYQIYYTISG